MAEAVRTRPGAHSESPSPSQSRSSIDFGVVTGIIGSPSSSPASTASPHGTNTRPSTQQAIPMGWASPVAGAGLPVSPAYVQLGGAVMPAWQYVGPQGVAVAAAHSPLVGSPVHSGTPMVQPAAAGLTGVGYGPAHMAHVAMAQPATQIRTDAMSVPRPLPSAAYPLSPATVRLTGVAVPSKLHAAACTALKDAGVDFDYSSAKFKAHCFVYTPDGPCYFILRCFAAPSAGGAGAGPQAPQGQALGQSAPVKQPQGLQPQDYLFEFQRQKGNPLAFLDAYEATVASLAKQGLRVAGPGADRLPGLDVSDARQRGAFQTSLLLKDNEAYEQERTQASGSSKAVPSASASPLFTLESFGQTVSMMVAAVSNPLADEDAVSSCLWSIAAMTRSKRFVGNVGDALGELAAAGTVGAAGSSSSTAARQPTPAAAATDALLRTIVTRACTPIYPGISPSSTIDSRTAACMALATLCTDGRVAAMLARGSGCPTLQAILGTAEALPVQADCVEARRCLVQAVAAVAEHQGLAATVSAGLSHPDTRARLGRLHATGTATGDAKMLAALAKLK